jgi:hypothetical protein
LPVARCLLPVSAQSLWKLPRNRSGGGAGDFSTFRPLCGKRTKIFRKARYFDGFRGGKTGRQVENPVENVDKSAFSPLPALFILGDYVD